jgi:hypothetical protein
MVIKKLFFIAVKMVTTASVIIYLFRNDKSMTELRLKNSYNNPEY